MASGRVRGQTFILNFLVVAQGPLQPELAHHPQASGPAGELGGRLLHPSAWYSRTRHNSHTTSDRPHVSRPTLHHAPSPAGVLLLRHSSRGRAEGLGRDVSVSNREGESPGISGTHYLSLPRLSMGNF